MEYNTSDSWTILSPIELSIKQKIEKVGTPLKDWDISINYGIKTGYNDAFIIDEDTKNRLIAEDFNSANIIRPILRGRDIKKYTYDFANLYLICTFPSRHIDINDYPAVKKHLESFDIRRLEQSGKKNIDGIKGFNSRKKTGNKWYETQDQINYWEEFLKPKIMYSEIVQEPQFYLDENGIYFPEATTFIMSGKNLKSIILMLNSNIIFYIFKTYYCGAGLGTHGIRYKKSFLLNL